MLPVMIYSGHGKRAEVTVESNGVYSITFYVKEMRDSVTTVHSLMEAKNIAEIYTSSACSSPELLID